jgi:hypothetical protein
MEDRYFVSVTFWDEIVGREEHQPPAPFFMLSAAKLWAAQQISEWFRDHDQEERDAAAELIDLVDQCEGDGPWYRTDAWLQCRVAIQREARRLRSVPLSPGE